MVNFEDERKPGFLKAPYVILLKKASLFIPLNVFAASAHARAAIYFEIDKEFPCRFVWLDGWMDGVYANEGLACVQTLLSTARESQIGTRCTSLIRNFRVCLFVGMDGWSICK